MTKIALIGPADRDEVQRLALRLEERSADAVIVDTRRAAEIRVDGERLEACGVSFDGVGGAYIADLGLPKPIASDAGGVADVDGSRAALAHSQATLAAWRVLLERLARRAILFNPPASHEVHALKPFEIASYAALGWRAPSTLSTDDARALLEVGARPTRSGRVRKALVGGWDFTEVLEPLTDLDAARTRLGESACMAQERIDGDAVRAFVVNGRVVVAVEVLPQGFGEVDSRRGTHRVRRIELPAEIAEQSKACVAHWGMNFAGVDWMRASSRNEWVLLECNSSPFWFELERRTGADIGSALADALLRRARRTKA